jgi:transposase
MAGFVENKPKCVMIVVPHHPAPLSAAKRGFLLHARQEKQQFDSTDWPLLAQG